MDETAGKLVYLDRGKKVGDWEENPNASADEFWKKPPASHSPDPRIFFGGEANEPNKAKKH